MGWQIDQCPPTNVSLADGNTVQVHKICRGLEWLLQGNVFKADFLLLTLGNCDMVLGIQWLGELGDIMFNFKKLTMKFEYQGRLISLQGTTPQLNIVDSDSLQHINGGKCPVVHDQSSSNGR